MEKLSATVFTNKTVFMKNCSNCQSITVSQFSVHNCANCEILAIVPISWLQTATFVTDWHCKCNFQGVDNKRIYHYFWERVYFLAVWHNHVLHFYLFHCDISMRWKSQKNGYLNHTVRSCVIGSIEKTIPSHPIG